MQGLIYGTRSALFMDLCTPAVAATQFTAYMAMMNLTIAYSALVARPGRRAAGYPLTLALDAALGLACLAAAAADGAARRARPWRRNRRLPVRPPRRRWREQPALVRRCGRFSCARPASPVSGCLVPAERSRFTTWK